MEPIKTYLPPKPEIRLIKALIREISDGKLRIPAFQRAFVWSDSQIVDLLDSIVKGYPIGSLLFWSVQNPILRVQTAPQNPFPDLPVNYPLTYVLDGLQRLSVLYGVFDADKSQENSYNIQYDLRDKTFKHYSKNESSEGKLFIRDLFSPKDLLKSQSDFRSLHDGDALIDLSLQLQTAFQEYVIPTVTISERSVREVVDMFHRINSTGTNLNAVDFMRALTWSEEFDLNSEIERLQNALQNSNYNIEAETLVKVVASLYGVQLSPSTMFALREAQPEELHASVSASEHSLLRMISFLDKELNIHNSDFVPYETQILAFARFFNSHPVPEAVQQLKKWFLMTTFNEDLRGRSENYISNVFKSIDALSKDATTPLDLRIKLTRQDLIDKRFKRGASLSAGIAILFAQRDVYSLITGLRISPEEFMQEFDAINFTGLLSESELAQCEVTDQPSKKMLANIILVRPTEAKSISKQTGVQVIEATNLLPNRDQVLRSQFISTSAIKALHEGNFGDFLELRAATLLEAITKSCTSGLPS